MPCSFFRRPSRLLIAILAAVVLQALCVGVAFAADEADLEEAIKKHAEKIVPVKFINKLSMGRNDQEIESEIYGVMIDPKGLVLCSNTQLGGLAGMLSRMLGNNAAAMNLTSDVTDVKLLIGDDEREVPAHVLARDTELDLAWVQVDSTDEEFPAVDLTKATAPRVGQSLLCVRKLGKYFDRSPVFGKYMVNGQTEKPRKLFFTQEAVSNAIGMFLFTDAGEPVGAAVLQMPASEETGSRGNPLAMMGSMMGQEGMPGAILPATEIVKATERARQAGIDAP